MDRRQIVVTVSLVSLLVILTAAGVSSLLSRAQAAPVTASSGNRAGPTAQDSVQFFSTTALAFQPTLPAAAYKKDVQRQILSLTGQNRNFIDSANIFVAPLVLPDDTQLLGATLFGEDFDNQGEVRLRLKRCDHSQARCLVLAETTSSVTLAAGQFQTPSVAIPTEIVDNRFFSYFWELELTALFNSGARSVRLEVLVPDSTASTEAGQWALTGDVLSFSLPNFGTTEARVCASDLSHLPNPTHYPSLVVDGIQGPRISSNSCERVVGSTIEIRRNLNTGPSSGTFEFIE